LGALFFLDRLTKSQYAENFVLKGGVLLAALDARRPTRDIDFAARRLANDTTLVLTAIRKIGAIRIDDGLTFGADEATGETIRDDDSYSGVRVTLGELCRGPLFRCTWMSTLAIPSGRSPRKLGCHVYLKES